MSESADFPRPGASRRRFLAGTGVLLAIAGFRAGLPRIVDDELAG